MKKKALISSILTIALCLSLIAGSTLALFTSESKVNVAVTSGNVEVIATAENIQLSSELGQNLSETSWSNTDNTISLNKIVPGDVLDFDLRIQNKSDVTIQYRTVIAKVTDDGLWNGLVVTIGGEQYDGSSKVAKWATMAPTSDDIIVHVQVKLPQDAGSEYMGKSCTFAYTVEAVQGNAEVTDAPEEGEPGAENYYLVANAEELAALSAKALTGNNGKAEEAIVELVADIDMKNADFSAMIAQRGDKLTILGNGHKISNVNVISGANDNTTGSASMFYAYPNSTLTVSNLVLENVTVTAEENATGYAAAVVGYCEGNVVLNNVDVVDATVVGVKSSGLLAGHLSGSLIATNCDVNGTVMLADFAEEANGHYAGEAFGTLAGFAALKDCTVDATVSGNLNAANIGDVYGRATSAGSLVLVENGVYKVSGSAGLAAAVESASNATIELAEGNYTSNFKVEGGKNLVIEGKGADKTVLSGQIATTASTEGTIILRNLTVKVDSSIQDSTGISQTGSSAIAIWGNQTVICENVTFDMSLSNSTAITSWWDTGVGTSIIVRNCTFNCNGQRPIRATGNVTVENCTFNDPYRYAVQLTAKASTATLLDKAIINFTGNTIVNGENGKSFVYGIQLEGADYGCQDLVINGSGNTIVDGGADSTMYYCECGKVNHETIEWNVETTPVHEV